MSKKTLLELVQSILNDLDSDYVNSINDTEEARQVATTIKSCYEELISNRNWPHLKKLIQLDASGTTSKPNYLKIPDAVKELESIKYDCRKLGETKKQYKDIKYKYPDEFLDYIYQRDSDKDNIIEVSDFSGVPLLIQNDIAPSYWTSFDDVYVVFDSYDASVDTTLQKAKTQTLAVVETEWEMTDDFIPNLPSEAFSLLEEESKSVCFLNLKQMPNQKAEQKAGRQSRWLSRKAWKAHGGVRYDDYGRQSRK